MHATLPSSRSLCALLVTTALTAQQSPQVTAEPTPPPAMQAIGKDELLRHANHLASDELGGRLTGSPGQHAAAEYIRKHFASLGLEPLGDPVETEGKQGGQRQWLQHYGIERTFVTDASMLQVGATNLKHGYAVLGGEAMDVELDTAAVWVGHGRTRGPVRDVAEGVDLGGKVAVVALRGPRGSVRGGLTVEQKFQMSFGVLSRLGRTARNLAKAGAGAVLFVQHDDKVGLTDVLNYVALSPGKAMVAPNFPGADRGMAMMARLARSGGVPTMVLSIDASRRVLAELGIDFDAFGKFVAAEEEQELTAKDGVACKLELEVVYDEAAKASNVVAVLRGSDPELRDEAIVYSAHMDHVGTRMDGDVFNGADDNASGSAGLLAIASAFAKAEQKPRRSVIFLSVSGEELGLWGSQYFSEHPTWQLDKLVANINTDMIGRSGPESGPMEVTVTPSHDHAKFSTIVRDAARFGKSLGMSFSSGDKYYTRSDHYNFARKGIPVVFFCNGEHEDYHQVTDHADKLDGDKMQRIARLAFWTGWHVANADERPQTLGRQGDW
ncbi:MAG: M20/M25/M40 family metallo-hydrolase [Planctomycetes bacterium]|nr:M20/M25/M40 family metallo-hydrolase [Planctomycetota bacterium]